jgi:lipoprotein-releasing system permease protein
LTARRTGETVEGTPEGEKPIRSERRFVSLIAMIATGGVAIGTAALIITLSILSGFENTLTDNLVGFSSHALIGSYGNRVLPDYPGTSKAILKRVPEITKLTPYVEQQAVLRSPHGVSGLTIKGLPLFDTSLIARKRIILGHDLANLPPGDSLDPILISKSTALELHTTVGKALAAIRFNEKLRTREDILSNFKRFRVVGIFETGMAEYDATLAYTTLEAAQRFCGYSMTQVNGYEVMTKSIKLADTVTRKINRVIHYPYFAQSVYDVHQAIFAWIDLQKKPIPIILGLIIIVATFNVISTLLLIVVEKTHSIGVLRSLGATSQGIRNIFLTEGVTIGLMGVLIGNAFAFTVCATESHFHFFKLKSDIYFMSSVPISIQWEHYAIVSVIAFVLALAATFIPAQIAARMRPLNALRFR